MILLAGASIVREKLRRDVLERLCSDFRVTYGANETWNTTVTDPGECLRYEGTVGRPAPGVEIQIVDKAAQPVRAGDVGFIQIRSASVVDSYLDDDAASERAFRNGWFMPGDLGRITEDGHLIFCGRADDMMIFNGINIYPIEIEQCLLSNPAVADAMAMPLKHHIHQDIPVCAVVLHINTRTTRDELAAFSRQRLGARAPHFIAILETIPRNQQGKPQRAELMRLVEAQLRQPSVSQSSVSPPSVPQDDALVAERPPRQPTRRINLDFQPPRVLQTGAIDAWLAILNTDLGPSRSAPSQKTAEAQGERVADWLERIILLARELLQVAQIPVFDALRLVSCRPQGQGHPLWRGVIAVPALDHVPTRVYEIAFGVAVRSAFGVMMQAPTSASRQVFFEQLQREAIQPLMRLASGGKSTLPLLRAAHARGIPFRSMGGGIYQLGLGAKGRLTDRSTNDRDSAIGLKLSQSKPLTAQALRLAGLPAPTHQVVSSIAEARAAAAGIGWPVVVKPADLERGEGVSVDVDAVRLDQAFEEAHRLSRTKQVIVERQVDGVCHRLFLTSGRLLYAVKRLPIGVYGDGSRTVEALVSAELAAQAGQPPWRRSEMRPIDDLARAAIAAVGLRDTSVPTAGQFVPLRRIESTVWGGVDEEVTDQVHPENLRVALATAELLGLDVAGIDIISPDISHPWHSNGAVINEVNFAPLLGGGEISRRHIDEYLARLLHGDGRIPLEAFLGGEPAWQAALARRKALGGNGAGIFVTSAWRTVDGNGQEIPMSFDSLHGRGRALLLSRQVHTLLLVVQNDEWLRTGLPVEYLDSVVDAGGGLRRHHAPDLPLPTEQEWVLRKLLSDHVRATLA
jgi:D-alanine-D-alanine ligase-like ATP-grasp enzyme